MSFFIPILTLTLLLSVSALAAAQEFDCNCSPVKYIFELKLDSITCPTNPEDLGPGVFAFSCNPGDEIPYTITSAQFVIADPDETIIGVQTKPSLNLGDGDTLEFTSPNTPSPLVTTIVLVLQRGVGFQHVVSITFTNECGVFALEEGAELGLVIFVSLESLCSRF